MPVRQPLVPVLLCALALAAPAAARPGVVFTDVHAEAGVGFRYTFGDFAYDNILESSGSGVTVFDYDGDGDLDLYLLQGTYLEDVSDPKGRVFAGVPNELYRNDGGGRFSEVGRAAGLDDRRWSMAATPLDHDGDGDLDLFVLNYGPNALYRNNGDGTFTDVAERIGLRGPERLNGFVKWSVGAAVWDYDRDGDADLMVCNFLAFDPYLLSSATPHLMPHPNEYRGQASMLLRREADGGYTDVTEPLGLHRPESKCMGLSVWDADGDEDLDLFQGNDHQANFLFRNDGAGRLVDVGLGAGVAVNDDGLPTGSMHGTVGDFDGDGVADLLVVDLRHGALYRGVGGGLYRDVTAASGVKAAFDGKGAWAAAFLDYDNDGDLDLFSANGTADVLELQPPLLLDNDGAGRFSDEGGQHGAYFRGKRSGRGAAVWDYDDDGDLDVVVSHVDLEATVALLRNDGGNAAHWIGVRLVGTKGPASAIAATVTVTAGGRTRVRINQPATSYLSSSDPRVHFGLGDARRVDRLHVRWPDGTSQTVRDLRADRYVTVVQGRGGAR